MRDTDEDYYDVTSAAKLFWKLLKEKGAADVNNGVSVIVQRNCTATNDGDNWVYTNCTFKVLSSEGSDILDGSSPIIINSANVSLFEAAALNVLFGTSIDIGASNISASSVTIDSETVKNSFLITSDNPASKNPDYTKVRFSPFVLTSPSPLSPVKVTVMAEENGVVSFSFEEDVPPGSDVVSLSYCTLTALMDVRTEGPVQSGDTYTFTTKVKWKPLYISTSS